MIRLNLLIDSWLCPTNLHGCLTCSQLIPKLLHVKQAKLRRLLVYMWFIELDPNGDALVEHLDCSGQGAVR